MLAERRAGACLPSREKDNTVYNVGLPEDNVFSSPQIITDLKIETCTVIGNICTNVSRRIAGLIPASL
jgi:hypothetical protein